MLLIGGHWAVIMSSLDARIKGHPFLPLQALNLALLLAWSLARRPRYTFTYKSRLDTATVRRCFYFPDYAANLL